MVRWAVLYIDRNLDNVNLSKPNLGDPITIRQIVSFDIVKVLLQYMYAW